MDLRYIMYLNGKGNYYELPKIRRETTELYLPELPEDWHTQIDEFGHWKYCYNDVNMRLREQGWKIHISTDFDEAQKTLDVIVPVLVENNVMFKFVANKWELFLKNSKYGDRSASGKFFTVYPQSDEQFIMLLDKLEKASGTLKKGPYILSDKRWKDSNVYFRYGGFAEMYTQQGATRVLAIKNASGEFVEDKRGPSYYLPDFVQEPIEIRQMDEEREQIHYDLRKFEEYQIEEALHFSNGGGVYKAKHVPTGTYVVLKEGRPGAGLDGQIKDGIQRIQKESEELKKLVGVKGVVQYFDSFPAWEHMFLAEEYVEGLPLNTWIAVNYPFSHKDDVAAYSQRAIAILEKVLEVVLEIHKNNIGMGDLQPMNIIVTPDDEVKLIDFEAANDKALIETTGLDTPGFVTVMAKSREEKDWFALLRISRHMFLPICPAQDLDEGIIKYQDEWIEQVYGSEPGRFIAKIEQECHNHFPHLFKESPNNYSVTYKSGDCDELLQKLRNGMVRDLRDGDQLLPGDIRQYETNGGKFNVLNGGFGIVLSLLRTGEVPEKARKWVEAYGTEKNLAGLENGLFTGKAGIAGVLFEAGYHTLAKQVYDSISISDDCEDISLRSGMAGIGMALAVASDIFKDNKFLQMSLEIAERIEKLFNARLKVTTMDPDALTIGLFDGWSGTALFFLLLYEITGEEIWKDKCVNFVERDLEECGYDNSGILQTKDSTRYFPYLAGGTAGIGVVMAAIKKNTYEDIWDKEYESIRQLDGLRCCYNGGLFRGLGGFLAMFNAMYSHDKKVGDNLEAIFRGLNLYLIRDDENNAAYFTGDYGYKLSGDIFSGTAGNMLAIRDFSIKDTWCSWMPLPNVAEYNTFS